MNRSFRSGRAGVVPPVDRFPWRAALAVGFCAAAAIAQAPAHSEAPTRSEAPTPPAPPADARSRTDSHAAPADDELAPARSPRDGVRDANALLETGRIAEALERYRRLLERHPDAHALQFNMGLAQFKLGEYDQARGAFEQASLSPDTALANDALYGIAACDHAQALAMGGRDARRGLEKTQQALSEYHDVLSFDPDHAGARDARLKAAALWTRLKERIEQQRKQQQDQEDGQDQDQKSKPQDAQESQQDQSQQDQAPQDQQQGESQSPPPEKQDRDTRDQPPDDAQQDESANEQQRPDPSKSPDERDAEQKQADQPDAAPEQPERAREQRAEEDKKEASREQALRELRRLMDRQRLNKDRRRQVLPPARVRPLDKDW